MRTEARITKDAIRSYSHSNEWYKKVYNDEMVVYVNGYITSLDGGIKNGDVLLIKPNPYGKHN